MKVIADGKEHGCGLAYKVIARKTVHGPLTVVNTRRMTEANHWNVAYDTAKLEEANGYRVTVHCAFDKYTEQECEMLALYGEIRHV